MNCPHRYDCAAYAVGALDPAERARFELHLPNCGSCSAEVRRSAQLPGLLAHVNMDEVLADPPRPPSEPLASLLRRIRRDRGRRRLLTAAALAGLAFASLLAGTAATVALTSTQSAVISVQASDSVEFVSVEDSDAWGEAELIPYDEGTQIKVTCSYPASRYTDGERAYRLVVTNGDGDSDIAGTWRSHDHASSGVTLFTHWEAADIDAMEIQRLDDGTPVLRWQR